MAKKKDYCDMDRYRLMALVVRAYETATDDNLDGPNFEQTYRGHVQEMFENDLPSELTAANVDRVTELLLAVKDILDKDN